MRAPAVRGRSGPGPRAGLRRWRAGCGRRCRCGSRSGRDAAAAERDPVVGGALGVHVGVRHVAERSRPSQPMSSQTSAGSGSVAIMEEFIGSQVACWPLRPAVKPSVQRRTYGARTVPYGVIACFGRDLRDRGRLVDLDAERFDGRGESLDQLHRVEAGAVRGPAWSRRRRRRDALGGLAGAVAVRGPFSPKAISAAWNAFRRVSWAGVWATSRTPPWWMSASMPSFRGDADDLVDGVVHGLLEADGGVVAVEPGVAVAAGDAVVEPAAVAAGGSVAAELPRGRRFEEGDGLFEVVRRPEAGVSAADDADVRGDVAGQRLPGSRGAVLAYQNEMPPLTVLCS